MNNILDGVRVLDFGRYIAGPFCATLLADLGADVIRIEKPAGGEDRFTVPINDAGEGAYYMQIGRNKRGITLNPASQEGREVVRRLVKTADVVVANLPYPALKKLGLDYETLVSIKPDIILTTGSAFGSTGPYATRGGFDTVAQAMSGSMYLSGSSDEPAKSFAPYSDFGTASLSAFGTLAALIHRSKTGEGQIVEGTLLGTALTFNNAALMEAAVTGLERTGSATRGQYNAPTDSFRTLDGYVTVQVVGAGIFKRWANLMAEQEWLDDPRFSSDQSRGDHADIICQRMSKWCEQRTNSEVLTELAQAGIPCGEMLRPGEVVSNEHIVAANMFQYCEYPGVAKTAPIADHPIRYSKTKVEDFKRAPTLGEHTTDILNEIGFSAEDIKGFKANGVI
ncbi:CoA transferase [Aliiglaciecola sp. 2_MG-2023]|uniref:CaiB/BaiF CoA transferase family protein n=1 Tax=unclassified Aliiglaciecola TaxID=2593648 RepID=UPI0026E263E9|nr:MULTISPECIES: CoA transferase [unclassified Aliiglaciecola]MDO6711588.1 CoA transferase [Aliiglaciecola sp. 2_MG-2023]MDO6752659.1 CoA transferase [Aliiglaciecola sp. 1_MG-2023]